MSKRPSLKPQDVCDGAWYYENKGSIDLILSPSSLGLRVVNPSDAMSLRKGIRYVSPDGICIRIPAKMLRATLQRQSGRNDR